MAKPLAQKYLIQEELGRGGFSVTWRARPRSNNQRQTDSCVIKELLLDKIDDWQAVEQFEREARVLSHLEHAHIPRFIEFIEEEHEKGKRLYLVQEQIWGEDLETLIAQGKYFTEAEVQQIALTVARVLVYLHQFSPPIVHRDIKPSNLMLSKGDKKIYLIDFGAVKGPSGQSSGLTVTGTFGYMPIEQLEGQAVPASDLYALGMTLIFLLSHRDPASLPKKQLKVDFRPHVNISSRFAKLLERLIEPDVSKRLGSAQELVAELEKLRQPESAQPKFSLTSTHWKWGLGALAMLGLLGLCSLREARTPAEPLSSASASSHATSLTAKDAKEMADAFYSSGKCSQALPYFSTYLESYPTDVEALFRQGYCYGEVKEHQKAVASFLKVLEVNPEAYNNLHYNLGYNYYELDRETTALEHFKLMLARSPKDPDTLNYMGLIYLHKGRYAQALDHFHKSLLSKPNYKYPLYNIGQLYEEQNKYTEALQAYDKAIAADATYARPHYQKGSVYYDQKNYAACIKEETLALQKDSDYPSAYNQRGLCYYSLKQYSHAIKDYQQAIKQSPSYATAHYNLGLAYDDQEKFKEALANYQGALQYKPDHHSSLNNIGYIYYRQKNFEQAVEYYSKAIEARAYSMYYNNRGNAYKGLKSCEAARQDWQTACKKGNQTACKNLKAPCP